MKIPKLGKSVEWTAARRSLLHRLRAQAPDGTWRRLFDSHWRVIYSVARRFGLSEAISQEIVQRTLLSAIRHLSKTESAKSPTPFKVWLRQMTRWRILEACRQRPAEPAFESWSSEQDARLAAWPSLAAFSLERLEELWEAEWQKNIIATALERIRPRVHPKDFQLFDLLVLRQWPIAKITAGLGVHRGQIYLAKHRVTVVLRKEIRVIEAGYPP